MVARKPVVRALGSLASVSLWLGLPLAASAALCVDPANPDKCFATIDGAVAEAEPGDTIKVADGTYTECVWIRPELAGLSIKGKSRDGTILDASGCTDDGLEIEAPDVSVRKLTVLGDSNVKFGIDLDGPRASISNVTVRNARGGIVINNDDSEVNKSLVEATVGNQGLRITGAGARITSVSVIDTQDDGILVSGPGAVLTDVEVRNSASSAIRGRGADLVVTGSILEESNDALVRFDGNNARIAGNTLSDSGGDGENHGIDAYGGSGNIEVEGNEIALTNSGVARRVCINMYRSSIGRAEVVNNRILGCNTRSYAIRARGTEVVVDGNDVTNDGGGIQVRCSACAESTLDGNVVVGGTPTGVEYLNGFDIIGNGMVVTKNRSIDAASVGFDIYSRVVLEGNRAIASGRTVQADGFRILGADSTITKNSAEGASDDGFTIGGTGHTLTKNKTRDNGESGFDFRGQDASVIGNKSDDNGDDGFQADAAVTGATFERNKAKNNGNAGFCADTDAVVTVSDDNKLEPIDGDGACSN